jgi:hypothetical protein
MSENLHNTIAHGQLIVAMTFGVRGCNGDTAPLDFATGPGALKKQGSGRIKRRRPSSTQWSISLRRLAACDRIA